MEIIFALSCLLISPIVLFTYGIIRQLNRLQKSLGGHGETVDSSSSCDTPAIIPSVYSRK